jgi:hypothetical protein
MFDVRMRLQEPPSGTGEQLYADVDEAMMAAGLLDPMQVRMSTNLHVKLWPVRQWCSAYACCSCRGVVTLYA